MTKVATLSRSAKKTVQTPIVKAHDLPTGMEGLEEFLEEGEEFEVIDGQEVPVCEIEVEIEDVVEPETIEEIIQEMAPSPTIRKVAKYPGIYPSPTKSNPGRFIANYRKDKKTIKIGFFNNEEEAHEAKEAIMNPPKVEAVIDFLEAVVATGKEEGITVQELI